MDELKNITVNGGSLKDFISAQTDVEISDVRSSNERLKVNRARVTRIHRNTSGARTAPGIVVYQAGQRESHVIVAGNMFRWEDKAPFERSGHSVLGALEYDAKSDQVKCHSCGQWCKCISQHVTQMHKQKSSTHGTAREYRIRHGLKLSSPMAIPSVTMERKARLGKFSPPTELASGAARNRTHGAVAKERSLLGFSAHTENANLIGACRAQRLKTLKEYAATLGRTPTMIELREFKDAHGLHILYPQGLSRLFGSVSNALIHAQLKPRRLKRRLA